MKLTRFLYGNTIYWGAVSKDQSYIRTSLNSTADFKDFQQVVAFFSDPANDKILNVDIDMKSVKILAPAMPTKNVLCIGKNYYEHILEFDGSSDDVERVRENPIFFSKATSSVIGHDMAIKSHPDVTDSVDYEAELAVVIGKTCLNVSEDEAYDYVFGYTGLNDVTARDLQSTHQQWTRGKSLDTFCPIGPWLVTADELKDPQNLEVQSYVNGELRQNGNTKLMMHSISSLISTLSQGMTLNPGDIIATGTPKGVGKGFNPPKYLKAGDKVEIRIEGIGSLINSVE